MPLPEFPERVKSLLGEELEGLEEVIYVRPEDGVSFSLNMTAASVLELCDGSHTGDDIARLLAEALPDESAPDLANIKADVMVILEDFEKHGLIYSESAQAD